MSGGVPTGWVLVPVVATEAMERAAFERVQPYHDLGDQWQMAMPGDLFRLAWPAMIAAVPATPTPPIEGRDADVERVARAIAKIAHNGRVAEETYRADPCTGCNEYRVMARAALQALGERG